MLLIVLAVIAGGMLGLSLFNLLAETGPIATLKAGLLTVGGTIVSYAINRFAIEKGAPLAAIGYSVAGMLSVFAILLVGGGMFASTYSGLVIHSVAERQLEDHGAHLSAYVGQMNGASLELARTGPLLRVQEADQRKYAACEIASSCLSGQREVGRGRVATTLEALAENAGAMAAQFDAGQASAQRILASANEVIAEYQKVLARTDLDSWQKHGQLLPLHGRIEQLSNGLSEAIPAGLLRSYANDLAAGVSIAGRPDATRRVNELLAKYAEGLTSLLTTQRSSQVRPPSFPRRPGVIDSFSYIGQFASIAAIVFVAEMLLPVTLWVFSYLKLAWRVEQMNRGGSAPASSDRTERFDGLIQLPPPPVRPTPLTITKRSVRGPKHPVAATETDDETPGGNDEAPLAKPGRKKKVTRK